jgi:hypothetical protein
MLPKCSGKLRTNESVDGCDVAGGSADDRPRMNPREEEKKRLETALQPGQHRSFDRQELDRLGYSVTSVDKDRPEYVD